MPETIQTGGVHHLRFTVSNLERARDFYTGVLGFQVVGERPGSVLMHNGSVLLGIGPAPEHAIEGDRFDENRVGLDHICFSIPDREALVQAERLLNERGIPNGGVKDLGPDIGIMILTLRDPDNIQLELSAPSS